ncbi:DUF1656 domain-containing protein [Sphingomonas sp. AP4-R1]|uniref:DUF1656 domain-containing protein n=1 Tax=Sphingomonas sp. AP4-R1 TaxID=2735134 RepID=UPI001493384A|nr:DUF1656 domain-containing protein [Sphingomonas sp. AP4-R1]QJU57730.1 DUF1656 domain-containing protein [Sphingomonas sp. AP4-R1]
MIGEISIAGVFLPSILLLAIGAAIITIPVALLLSALGLYRFVANRPLVEVALFILILGLVSLLTGPFLS